MTIRNLAGRIFLTLISSALCVQLHAQLRLPVLISDNMVLQRNTELTIWGWGNPGEKVTLSFQNNEYNSPCLQDSTWSLTLPAQPAGGPYSIEISSGSESIQIENVLFGDVWVCSGQSNMETTMERVSPLYPEESKTASNKNIRYFQVPKTYYFKSPKEDTPGGKWVEVSPETISPMSAVSYFFGKELNQTYDIPIGLINSALGGSPIQSWMSEESLKQFPDYYQELQKFKSDSLIAAIEYNDHKRNQDWYRQINQTDKGISQNWYNSELNTDTWPTMQIPGYWANEAPGAVNGVVWFRKTFDAPASMTDQVANLTLGTIVDADSVFVNGVFVGTTSYQYPPRRYQIPDGVLKEQNNTIVIRVINERGRGGFTPNKDYEITTSSDTIDLKGEWSYQVGVTQDSLDPPTFIKWKPGGLFNAMLAPLTSYPIKGVIWYQGESNTWNPEEYEPLLKTMVQQWRSDWNQPELPFIVAQLPNYMKPQATPSQSNWARMRESQAAILDLPNTGIGVNIDLGEWNDIHPLNKQDVAKRLALAARKVAYQETDLAYSSPMFKSMRIKGSKTILSFDHTYGSLKTSKGMPAGFAVAGADQQFVWAKAQIKGDKVILKSSAIKKPVAVRYAWADNPDKANIYNAAGLPMAPFRADDWSK